MFTSTLLLVEKFCDEDFKIKLAKTILKCQEISEGSWDDSTCKYQKSMEESTKEALVEMGLDDPDHVWYTIILTFNSQYWNDIQYWCEAILKPKEEISNGN